MVWASCGGTVVWSANTQLTRANARMLGGGGRPSGTVGRRRLFGARVTVKRDLTATKDGIGVVVYSICTCPPVSHQVSSTPKAWGSACNCSWGQRYNSQNGEGSVGLGGRGGGGG